MYVGYNVYDVTLNPSYKFDYYTPLGAGMPLSSSPPLLLSSPLPPLHPPLLSLPYPFSLSCIPSPLTFSFRNRSWYDRPLPSISRPLTLPLSSPQQPPPRRHHLPLLLWGTYMVLERKRCVQWMAMNHKEIKEEIKKENKN